MEFPRIAAVLCVAFLISSIKCDPTTYYMTSECDSTIFMFSGSILLDLTPFSSYDSNMKCAVTVESDKKYMDRIMVKVLWIDVESSFMCKYDRLMIYDGASTRSPKLTGNSGICGTTAPSSVYKTTGQSVTFNFTSDGSRQKRGFQLLVTGFDDSGICLSSSEYECDNGYCVANYLECDGYDNCGDHSDEDYCSLSTGGIIGITFGCIAGAFILAAFVILIASRGNNRPRTVCRRATPAVTERTYLPGGQPYTIYGSPIAQNTLPPSYDTLFSTRVQFPGQAVGGQVVNPNMMPEPK